MMSFKRKTMESAASSSAVSPLIEVCARIRVHFDHAINIIDKDYITICQGIDEVDGRSVVDTLETFIPEFYEFADKASILKETSEMLVILPVKLKESPSASELRRLIDAFLSFDEMSSYKTEMYEAMNADDGSVMNDFLQGNTLTKIRDVADACHCFVILERHLEEIERFINGEFFDE